MLKHKTYILIFETFSLIIYNSKTRYIYSYNICQYVDLSLYKHAFVNQFIFNIY